MQLQQIELGPGESIRIGTKIVTLIAVHDNVVELHVEDDDADGGYQDPDCFLNDEVRELAFA